MTTMAAEAYDALRALGALAARLTVAENRA